MDLLFHCTAVTQRTLNYYSSSASAILSMMIYKIGMADERECEKEMFVSVQWGKNDLTVPLSQLMPISSVPEATQEAVEDWQGEKGYQLC